MSPLIIVFVLALGLVALYIKLNPNRRASGNLPPLVPGLPFIGVLPQFSKNPVAAIRSAYNKFGDCFTFHILGFNMTYLVGPKAHEVFFKGSDEELSPKEAYQFVVPVFGRGIVYDSPTAVMYEQLRFIKSGLVVGQLKKNIPIMEKEARAFFDNLGKSTEIDLLTEMNNLTIRTASRCLLGPEIREDPKVSSDFAALYHDLEGGLNPLAFFYPYAPLPAHWRRDKARKEISALFSKVIKKRRQNPEEKYEDMLQILMECEYKNGERLTDDAITGMLLGILFAGQHTSGITATWTAFFLHDNPAYYQELLQEQEEIRKEFGDEISFDSLRKSVKLENAIRESLRMFPPLIILMRKICEPLKYGDIDLPVGDLLCVSPGAAMRLPDVYKNPDTWDPTRFDRGEHLTPYAYLAFGGGRHGCPGENFGILQIKTIWTVLLRTFTIEIPKENLEKFKSAVPPADYTNLVVGPVAGANVRLVRK